MARLNISKSDYIMGMQCTKSLWLSKFNEETPYPEIPESVRIHGEKTGISARSLFGNYVLVDDFSSEAKLNRTQIYLEEDHPIIAEASFSYDGLFCSVDILKKCESCYEIYEVKSATEIKETYIPDAAFQYYILKNLGYKISKVNLVYINNQYERKGELDLNQLFNIEIITKDVECLFNEIENDVQRIREFLRSDDEPAIDIGNHCFKPEKCPYFDFCKHDLISPNVFDISGLRKSKMVELYKRGVYRFDDLVNESALSDKMVLQVLSEINNADPYINYQEINSFVEEFTYPMYFLDFETFQQSVPEYDNLKPYTQIPFQYSLHILESENAVLEHREFLAKEGEDPRRALALALINDIPMDVCSVAYNMRFEKMVIKELARLYPDLSYHLLNINDNMMDLMIPFQKRQYYQKEMKGSYSIKYVLPALFPNDEELDYSNLQTIHNGSEAMGAFASLDEKSEREIEKIREGLLQYCKLDTFAMVKIWERLTLLKGAY